MNEYRLMKKFVAGQRTSDGAGVRLQRVIANHDVYDFDPFLMLDAFDSKNPDDYVRGFPWHPHRGIETITYLISGRIEHMDSLGNKGEITDNYCQWMTAGSGIMHQEMPLESPQMLGFQLWLNLPKVNKMCQPAYHDIDQTKIPKIQEENALIHLISGAYLGHEAPAQGDYVKAMIMDVELKADTPWEYLSKPEDTLFIYIFYGKAILPHDQNKELSDRQAVLFDNGNKLVIKAGNENLRFALFSAKALSEPIAWGGPIVMNTREELHVAFKELDEGNFIKNHPK